MPPRNLAERRAFVSSVLQINVVPPSMYQPLGLRTHSAGAAESGTRIAWISFAKVQRSADLAAADLGDVLGYVVAHEIGHLLLPANSHSVGGVMQENVDPKLIAHNRLSFLEQEATLIRRALADRIARARAAPRNEDH
jgi:hypothetical protein